MKRIMITLSAAFAVTLMGQINAASLVLLASDPVLDQFGPSPDLIQMDFAFDNATGNYAIDLETTNANPFVGDFDININLFNLDVGTTAEDPSLFSDTFNIFSFPAPTTTLTLTGNSARLLAWDAGDRILLNNLPNATPHPDGISFFRSSVHVPPGGFLENEDLLGVESQINIVSAVPIPPAIWLFGSGILGLVGVVRRKEAA